MTKKKRKLKKGRIVIAVFILFIIVLSSSVLIKNISNKEIEDLMPKLNNIDEVNELVEILLGKSDLGRRLSFI